MPRCFGFDNQSYQRLRTGSLMQRAALRLGLLRPSRHARDRLTGVRKRWAIILRPGRGGGASAGPKPGAGQQQVGPAASEDGAPQRRGALIIAAKTCPNATRSIFSDSHTRLITAIAHDRRLNVFRHARGRAGWVPSLARWRCPARFYKHLAIGCQSQLMCVGPHDLAPVSTIVR